MTKAHDDYKKLDLPETPLEVCPVCASKAELWQFSKSETDFTSKSVMCSNGDAFGPQQGSADEGCLLYMPPPEFYKATIREAVKFWNEYAKSLTRIQRYNRWKISQVLRTEAGRKSDAFDSLPDDYEVN